MFYNIMKKPKKQEKKPQIIADYREKNSLVIPNLISLGAEVIEQNLLIGDYLIGNTIIERKDFKDFISSMINKRLFKQLEEIKKYPDYFLLIENKEKLDNKNLEKAADGMILTIITEFKIPIIFTEDEEETAEILFLLAKKQEKKPQELSMRPSRSNLTEQQRKQYILEGFEGIGPKKAKKLLEKYKTLKAVFNASQEELKEVIGKKVEVFRILN